MPRPAAIPAIIDMKRLDIERARSGLEYGTVVHNRGAS
jgi:hypothetical protein